MSLKGYHGVVWESDVIAYGICWNADNAMDILGKTRPVLSLDGWATPGVPHAIENECGLGGGLRRGGARRPHGRVHDRRTGDRNERHDRETRV
jgi:hypothetical protein